MTLKIEIPTQCPSCDTDLELVNNQLFCRSKDCPAQSTKKVEAFVKIMRIKGLGPASISKLGFTKPREIYETNHDTYFEVLGDKVGQKICDEVDNSCLTTFGTFLAALSIPLIGSTASKKIASKGFSSILDILDTDSIEGVGPKAYANLYGYLKDNYQEVRKLELNFTFGVVVDKVGDKGSVCITGKLNDFSNRAKAKEFLEEHGYTVTASVTGKTDYLVDEEGRVSSKSKKANTLDIPIVDIVDLIN